MKNKAVGFFALAAPAVALLPLAGCGSGGGGSNTSNTNATLSPSLPTTSVSGPLPNSAPTPSPSPNGLLSMIQSTSDTDITTRANYNNPDRPSIVVTFPALYAVGFGTSARYHVYRNDVIVNEMSVFGNDKALVPGDEPPLIYQVYIDQGFARPIAYQMIGTLPTQLVQGISQGVPAFSADTPIVYRITLIRGTLDNLGQTTYTETEIGRSNQITPFR